MLQTKTRIPTMVGLALLIIAIVLGIGLYYYQKAISDRDSLLYQPANIQLSNITDTSLTITWTTNLPTSSYLKYGLTKSLSQQVFDSRDQAKSTTRTTHFFTLKGLQPDSSYYLKIYNNSLPYPDSFYQFKTAPQNNPHSPGQNPLVGLVVDAKNQPVNDGLVFLQLADSSILSTFISHGNFLLPITQLRTADLSKFIDWQQPISGQLQITANDQISRINLKFPLTNSQLPKITLGQDLDLSSQPVATPKPTPQANNPDINGDGQVNTVDLFEVNKTLGQKGPNLRTDLNGDGIVDQKDVTIIKQHLL